jgi:hypothetical protein
MHCHRQRARAAIGAVGALDRSVVPADEFEPAAN